MSSLLDGLGVRIGIGRLFSLLNIKQSPIQVRQKYLPNNCEYFHENQNRLSLNDRQDDRKRGKSCWPPFFKQGVSKLGEKKRQNSKEKSRKWDSVIYSGGKVQHYSLYSWKKDLSTDSPGEIIEKSYNTGNLAVNRFEKNAMRIKVNKLFYVGNYLNNL